MSRAASPPSASRTPLSFETNPARVPVAMATAKLAVISATANRQPSIPKVRNRAVTVVAGVAMKNASVDALDAPRSYKLRPVGITPHEHSGNGIPTNVAMKIERSLPVPRYLSNSSDGTNAFRMPANKKPNSSHGAASSVNSHVRKSTLASTLANSFILLKCSLYLLFNFALRTKSDVPEQRLTPVGGDACRTPRSV